MKNNLILALLLIGLFFQSCERTEAPVFDVDNGPALIQFAQSNVLFPVAAAGSTTNLEVYSNTRSSSARNIQVSISSDSAADPSSYVLGSGVIPANEFVGTIPIDGVFNALPASGFSNLVIELIGVDGSTAAIDDGGGIATVGMFRFCAYENNSTFLGDYQMTTTDLGIFDTPTFTDGVVTVSQGATVADRVISVIPYPAFGSFDPIDFSFSLICGEVLVGADVATGVGCGGSSTLVGKGASVSASYDEGDDSTIVITFGDDLGGASCGVEEVGQITLTKL